MLEAAIYYWAELKYSGHVYSHVSPYDHTLKGKKPDKDEIQIRLDLGALTGLSGPKGAPKRSPPKGAPRGYKSKGKGGTQG